MKVIFETSLENFEAWAGAVDTKEKIIEAGKAEEFNELIEACYPDGISATELNDILWYNTDGLYEILSMAEE